MILSSKKDLLPDLGFLNIFLSPLSKKKEPGILEETAGFKSGTVKRVNLEYLVPG